MSDTVTLSVEGSAGAVRSIVHSLADQHPALEPLKGIGIRQGHADVELDLPKIGDVIARVVVNVRADG